jgi:hypothetical protein
MGHEAVWNSHPKDYGKGGRRWCAALRGVVGGMGCE